MRRVLLLLLALSLTATSARALTIRGDRHWLGDTRCPEGWRLLEFDDSGWTPIAYPWTQLWPREWPLDREARPIWGNQPSPIICLRRSFNLDELPGVPSVVHIWADDDYDLYINGIPVGASTDRSAEMPGETYDITPLLRLGKNVVAVRGNDTGGTMAILVSVRIPEIADAARSATDRLIAALPWISFVAVVLSTIGWVFAVRALTRRAAAAQWSLRWKMVITVILAAACQVTFAVFRFYSSHREMPVAVWDPQALVLVALLLAALAIACVPKTAIEREGQPVRYEAWWLLGILVLATALRIYRLDSVPPGFFQDEATNGNDAIALRDLDEFAIWSDSIGGRPTLFLYMLLGVLQLAGVSYLKLKIVPVVLGIAAVAALHVVGRLAVGPRAGLWAAFLLAVSRWDIHYSRMAWEAICVPLFATLGFGLLLFGLRQSRWAPASLIASAVVLAGGLYTYAAYRAVPAVVLVFLLATLLTADRIVLRRQWLAFVQAGIVAVLIAAPLVLFAWEQPDLYWYRYSEVSLSGYMAYYGTPTPWLHQFGKGLLSLTAIGDEIVRHNLPWWPHLDRITGGLMLVGMAAALGIRGNIGLRLMWCWFLTFMALATLTMDGPHATRLLGVAPVATLFAAFGVTHLLDEIAAAWRPRIAAVVATAVVVAVTAINSYEYFVLEANYPGAEAEYNVTGRSLCERVCSVPVPVDLHWTDDIAYWSDGQCKFLAQGRYTVGDGVELQDVLRGSRFGFLREPTLVAVGQEFLDKHRDAIPRDAEGNPKLSLPGEPIIERDRDGRVLYHLYSIALPAERN